MATQRRTAIGAAVRVLRDEGAGMVFGLPGAPLTALYAALAAGGVPHMTVRHPESAPHMAAGWARARGRAAVAAVPGGPEAPRVAAGLHTALADAVPMVCVIGTADAGGGTGPDLLRLTGPLAKWTLRATDPALLPWAFRTALQRAREGRAGPVVVEVPAAVAAAEIGDGGSGGAPPHPGPLPEEPVAPEPGSRSAVHLVGGAAPACGLTAHALGPRCHRVRSPGGPPGWEVPAAIGLRLALDAAGDGDAEVVVAVDGDPGFASLAGELAGAARHGVPLVLLVHHPAWDPVRRAPGTTGAAAASGSASGERLTDHVRLAVAYGCTGRHVTDPADVRSAVAWARKEAVSTRRPVLLEVRFERVRPVVGGAVAAGADMFSHGAQAP